MSVRRVLFVRPDSGPATSRIATDHYAEALAAIGGYRVFMLGGTPGAGVEYLGPFATSVDADISSARQLLRRRREQALAAQRMAAAELVHVRNFAGDFLLAGALRGAGARVLVLDIQTLAVAPMKHALFRTSGWLTTRRFDHVFTINQTIARAYCPGHASVSELPVGFDARIWQPPHEPPSWQPGQTLRCIYSGVLHPARDLGAMCDAFCRLQQAGEAVELHVYGDGPAAADLARRAGQGVVFHGHVPTRTLVQAMHTMHVGIGWVPTGTRLDANTPLKTLEMLACGLPVIATATAGNQALVESVGGGLLVDASSAALQRGVREVLGGALSGVDRHALAGAVAQRDWQRLCVRHLLPAYERLVGA